jgi:hypothetical protein
MQVTSCVAAALATAPDGGAAVTSEAKTNTALNITLPPKQT